MYAIRSYYDDHRAVPRQVQELLRPVHPALGPEPFAGTSRHNNRVVHLAIPPRVFTIEYNGEEEPEEHFPRRPLRHRAAGGIRRPSRLVLPEGRQPVFAPCRRSGEEDLPGHRPHPGDGNPHGAGDHSRHRLLSYNFV